MGGVSGDPDQLPLTAKHTKKRRRGTKKLGEQNWDATGPPIVPQFELFGRVDGLEDVAERQMP